MAKIETFEQLLLHQIGDLLSAEEQLLAALPKLAQASTSVKLKTALQEHLRDTEKQLQRLERMAEILELESGHKKTCKAMKGLIAEGEEALKEIPAGPVRDAAIIGAAQRVEHYEMAAYGTARAFAELLEENDVVKLLTETYKEELLADQLLTKIADGVVNLEALRSSSDE